MRDVVSRMMPCSGIGHFSATPLMPILVTWPKKNGVFDTAGNMESIVINPARLYESIQIHFNRYVKTLREGTDPALKSSFETAVKLKWALDEPDRVIGMMADEFHKT